MSECVHTLLAGATSSLRSPVRWSMRISNDSDFANRERLQELAPTEEAAAKIRLMTDFSSSGIHDHVPDPYYGGASGFELVLDILEECTAGLFSYLTEPHDNSSQSACD